VAVLAAGQPTKATGAPFVQAKDLEVRFSEGRPQR
jgi:hypothetical protein